MGLFSSLFGAVSGLFGKKPVAPVPVAPVDDSWRRHKKRHVSAGALSPAPVAPVDDSWKRHAKRHVSAGAPKSIDEEIEALRQQTAELQRHNAMLIRAIEAGGRYGNAKASSDMTKLANQQRVADAIDKAREESGAEPGSQEWEEARARALDKIRAADLASDFADHSDPDTQVTLDLTEEEQAALDAMPDNPW